MYCLAACIFTYHSPGKVGRCSECLLIDKISPSADTLSDKKAHCADIEHSGYIHFLFFRSDTGSAETSDYASVYCKSSAVYIEYLQRFGGIITPAENHIIQSCADYTAYKSCKNTVKKFLGIDIVALKIFHGEEQRKQKARADQYAVPINTEIAYRKCHSFDLKLYPNAILPDYRLICIDEGQDLHPADYELIRELFPGAVLNVFGDRAQSLHEGCGVEDWNADTGIEKVFRLDKNYRNPPDIVEFCNRRFHESMEYCGSLESERIAEETRSLEDLREYVRTRKAAVIVKDRTAFQKLREELPSLKLCYLDMDSSEVARGMVPCYSVHAAKGLEFSHVAVIPDGMSHNQQVVACTRATESLLYADIGGEQ